MNIKINTLPKNDIEELIKTKTQKQIAEIYNVSQKTIGNFLLKNNIKVNSRKRINESRLYFNIDYFDSINSEKKAYWLGYISADGCLKNNKVNIVSKDKEIIFKFKNDLCSEHKLCESTIYDKRTKKSYTSYSISITNNLFNKKVQNYINIDKSNSFRLPKLEDKYYPFFIAGMFDGDGHVGFNKNIMRCSLISTSECLIEIQDILEKIGIKKTKLQNSKKYSRLYLYKDTFMFLKFIYNEEFSEIYLSRKYNLYKKIKLENENIIH
jgi:hypothetical protein